MHDLTTTQGVLLYLARTRFAATDAQRLSGGLSAFTYRVTLRCPLETGETTIVLKHSEDYVAVYSAMKLDPARSAFEYNALKALWSSGLFHSSSIVQTPRPIHYDEETHTIFMSDLGPDVTRLSETLATGRQEAFTNEDAEFSMNQTRALVSRIGSALGDFLGRFQNWGALPENQLPFQHPSRCAEILTIFQNLASRSAVKFGVNEKWFEDVLQEEKRKAAVDAEVLATGDLWMENILISRAPEHDGLRIYIVDWELCRPACPESDLSELTGVWLSFAQHYQLRGDDPFLPPLLRAYRKHRTVDPARMSILTGMYAMGLGTTGTWARTASEEFRRDMTLMGHGMMKLAHLGDEEAIKTDSPLKHLFN